MVNTSTQKYMCTGKEKVSSLINKSDSTTKLVTDLKSLMSTGLTVSYQEISSTV